MCAAHTFWNCWQPQKWPRISWPDTSELPSNRTDWILFYCRFRCEVQPIEILWADICALIRARFEVRFREHKPFTTLVCTDFISHWDAVQTAFVVGEIYRKVHRKSRAISKWTIHCVIVWLSPEGTTSSSNAGWFRVGCIASYPANSKPTMRIVLRVC